MRSASPGGASTARKDSGSDNKKKENNYPMFSL